MDPRGLYRSTIALFLLSTVIHCTLAQTSVEACNCSPVGSTSDQCDPVTNQCDCRPGFDGLRCDECLPNHFQNGSDCPPCNCSETGSLSQSCDEQGVCSCKPGVAGAKCDRCLDGYFAFSESGCQPCECSPDGSSQIESCNSEMGQCTCLPGVSGRSCDTCPPGTVGPSRTTASPCVDCFCNGFSRSCNSSSGWFQAKVSNSFLSESERNSFRTNGMLSPNTTGFLEAEPLMDPNRLVIVFPLEYLGDKRTSYSQSITLNLSLPSMAPDDSCEASVEIISRPTRYRQLKLILHLPPLQRDPQLYEIPIVPGDSMLDLGFIPRPASEREVRSVLTNIRRMRLVVEFPQEVDPDSRKIRLFETSLEFATDSPSDLFIEQPLRNVSYVEECTCPPNRMGSHCGECASGYTTDPTFGGEFALCVRCFCNFHSDSCDPITGVCFNCSDNTIGGSCEQCAEGFFRQSSLTIDGCIRCDCDPRGTIGGICNIEGGQCLCEEGFAGVRCDQCQDGFFNPGNGSCIPCNCNPNASLSLVCNKITGVCDCREGVMGDRCDSCQANTTGIFPSCEPCDECTGQWWRRIEPIRNNVETTVELVMSLNITIDDGELPTLDALFQLLQEIQSTLNASQIDLLSEDVRTTHALLCNLNNQTRLLTDRALLIQSQLQSLENTSEILMTQLAGIIARLSDLQNEFENISQFLDSVMLVDSSLYLALAQEALERSNRADELISNNVTLLVNSTELLLSNYSTKLQESQFVATQQDNMQTLAFLIQRLGVFEELIAEANRKLCGAQSTDSCDDCGGINCTTCGGESCESLVTAAAEAENISERAVEIAREKLNRIQAQVDALETILRDAQAVRNDSVEAEQLVNETFARAEALLRDFQMLNDEVERELRTERPDPDLIGELENMTLSLQLPILPEDFLRLLVQINETIDAFFADAGVNDAELRRRVEEALRRAELANELAIEIVSNATNLTGQLQQLRREQQQAQQSISETQAVIADANNTVAQTESILDDAEAVLSETRALVDNLTSRLEDLEQQIVLNELHLAEARNLTSQAVELASEVDQDSTALEEEFTGLREDAQERFQQSERDLEEANDLRNRTIVLQRRTQQQLLDLENLERIKDALMEEQEEIRVDIRRIANELESLSQQIQIHIARNTACLDTGTLQKRK